jgi:signal transduction histidine kinase/DNA-binding response OmpR family regulator
MSIRIKVILVIVLTNLAIILLSVLSGFAYVGNLETGLIFAGLIAFFLSIIAGIIGSHFIKHSFEEAAALKKEAESHIKDRTAFLANMSHELRTPLNVVIGLTDLILEDDRIDMNITENLIKISNAGGTLLNIVNNILDFSKVESGRLSLTPIEYYTPSLINDVVTLVMIRLRERPITFSLDIDDNLPVKLYGDDLRVKQIFSNLLTNAVKYTRQGNIEFALHCKREGDAVWIEAAVTDTGIGIREEDLKNLFSDYYQVDSRANRSVDGTGLGLSITKKLVEKMNGEIHVESEFGKGSTFRLRLKQGFISDTPIGAELAGKLRNFHYAEDKRIVSKRFVRINLSYAKVLVVDDMRTNLDVAAGLLRKYKMQVDCLTCGQDAIDRIRYGTPVYNAIFMDHMMPGMDGIETVDAIRNLNSEYAMNIPIIALTANAIHGTEELFYAHGFQAFMTKPIDIMELDSVIRKWVRNETMEDLSVSGATAPAEAKNAVINIEGVDTDKGLAYYGMEMDIYLSILRSFAVNTPILLKKLEAVSAETLRDYVVNVHGLKGTCANIGAETIRETALNLETIARTGNINYVLANNAKLISDTGIVVANVKAWLADYDAHSEKKPRLKAPDRKLLARLRQSCETYDMTGIDEAMSELEKNDYDEDTDLMSWLRERIDVSEISEVAQKLADFKED